MDVSCSPLPPPGAHRRLAVVRRAGCVEVGEQDGPELVHELDVAGG